MNTGPIVYVALGDSTGAGVGARKGGYVARLFKRIEERRPGSKLSNLCASGATTDDVVRSQLDRWCRYESGSRDCRYRHQRHRSRFDARTVFKKLRRDPQHAEREDSRADRGDEPSRYFERAAHSGPMRSEYQRQIVQFCRRLEEIANRHGVTVFDIYTITKDELPSHPEYFSSDGFHPSDEGYELWATQMWPTIAQVNRARLNRQSLSTGFTRILPGLSPLDRRNGDFSASVEPVDFLIPDFTFQSARKSAAGRGQLIG